MSTAGAITDTFTYSPYGQLRSHVGSSVTPYQYCGTLGYYTDGTSGRVYVDARAYQPALTSWLTVDPGWPSELPYVYVQSNATSFTDRFGLGRDPNCIPLVYDVQTDIYSDIIGIQGLGLLGAVNACIAKSCKSYGVQCNPLTALELKCLYRASVDESIIRCGDLSHVLSGGGGACGVTPNAPGVGRNPGGASPFPHGPITIDPNPQQQGKCGCDASPPWGRDGHRNQLKSSYYITLLHEMLHSCGYNHSPTGKTKNDVTCNDIAVCCIRSIASPGAHGGYGPKKCTA